MRGTRIAQSIEGRLGPRHSSSRLTTLKTTRVRFIGVALLVCLFAIGMATFLNYFKYKSTLRQIVNTRLLVIGLGIENSIQSSLALGLNFAEIGTLQGLIEREKVADRLISAISVFDTGGRVLYSTQSDRVGQAVPANWLGAATRTTSRDWFVEEPDEFTAGLALKNNFDLTVGHLVIRYARGYVDRNVSAMGVQLATISAIAFACVVLLVPLALLVILRRFERDMHALEERVAGTDSDRVGPVAPAFAPAVEELRTSIKAAEAGLAQARAKLAAVR